MADTIRLDIPAERRIAGRGWFEGTDFDTCTQTGVSGEYPNIGADIPEAAWRFKRVNPSQRFGLAGCELARVMQRLRMRCHKNQRAMPGRDSMVRQKRLADAQARIGAAPGILHRA